MRRPILEIKNVTKLYRDKGKTIRALNDVSLDLYPGEILGLLGVNGAGKTTLSSIIATLHPPTSGTILFEGHSIYKNIISYRKALGLCPQRQNLDTFLTVRENLVFAGKYFLLSEQEIKERLDILLSQLQLTKYADFSIRALSGGTKQRVLIARALMHNPKIVILDEPTVGLDPDIRRSLWDQILKLKAMGISVILTTHYLDEAEYLSDRICILHEGSIRLIESVKALKEQRGMQTLENIFIELLQEYREQEC